MASPFFSTYRNKYPSESRYSPSVPLKRKPETPSPKVISIPVHFVGSEKNRSDSALKIQKVLRGFLVRKSVNKIVCIKKEVDETERRIAQNETIELIRKDQKERLRINETLMASLFKLDSIRGIDSGVRELRKGVIKKAIGLQEKVDSLVTLAVDPTGTLNEMEAAADSANDHSMTIENPEEVDNCVVKEIVEEGCNTMNSNTEIVEEEMKDCSTGVEVLMSEEVVEEKKKGDLQTQMMRMMSELVEKNELQTRMINSLTNRVGQLEKAFLCDKLGRSNNKKKNNKKRNNGDAAAAADGKQQ